MKALINIIKNALGSDSDDKERDSEEGNTNSEMRHLLSISELKDDIINYGKHLLPILIFFVLGILSLPAWPICCFCTCCNCCCCCCCKKPGCKIPCFIFTYIFYALSVAICIYGLTQTNKIFVGIADTECSMLRFFEQILEGEIRNSTPRWPGIEGIDGILSDINNEIEGLRGGALESLNDETEKIENVKNIFKEKMDQNEQKFSTSSIIEEYSKTYNYENIGGTDRDIQGTFVLDLIKFYGKKGVNGKYEPNLSLLHSWQTEYSNITETADSYLEQANDTFTSISSNSSEDGEDDIIGVLGEAQTALNGIKGTFNDIKSEIEGLLFDNSELIDKYGRLGFKIVFGVLTLMNVALAALMLFICLCSGKMCTKCGCCRCIKLFTNIIWNILALLTYVTFIMGFIFSLVGTLGNDVMSVISFVLSPENLAEDGEGVIINKLDSKPRKYLNECVNGEGDIMSLVGMNLSQQDSFNKLRTIRANISASKQKFKDKKQLLTYTYYKDELNSRLNLTSDKLMLIKNDFDMDISKILDKSYLEENKEKMVVFKAELEQMNQFIIAEGESEQWSRESNYLGNECKDGNIDLITDSSKPFNLWKCKPLYRDWIQNKADSNDKTKIEAQILTDTLNLLEEAKDLADINSYLKSLEDLKVPYDNFLDQYIKALDGFDNTIGEMMEKLEPYIGENDDEFFSFINGKFIKINIKILLKYLKSILGGNVKTIGICLYIVGCSLALSISSTILLIVIINISIDQNKKELDSENVPEYIIFIKYKS